MTDEQTEVYWPTWGTFRNFMKCDLAANRRNPKIQVGLVLLRICQLLMADRVQPRKRSLPLIFIYRFYSEIIIGYELRPKTVVGPGVSIHHGFGLVVNDGVILGASVELRNGVTIGHARHGEKPPQIHDGVSFGANSVAIGDITVGRDSRIGAGAVVTRSCPPGSILVGARAANIAPHVKES